MNNKQEQFTANELLSNAVVVISDSEGNEISRLYFWVVLVFGFFAGLIPLAVVLVAFKQWKVALVNKEDVLK